MIMSRRLLICLFVFVISSCSSAQVPPVEDQIGAAVLAAPEEFRDGARVLGYERPGHVVELRAGTNAYVCLTDNPEDEGFSVACYHEDLDPYMARGRELREAGVGATENLATREAEVEAGTLPWPSDARTLYIRSGSEGAYDAETGTADESSIRYVIYVPYATAESTGLSESPAVPGAPWIMAGGTYRAHVMIIPTSN